MSSTNNLVLWDKQCPSFLGPINATQQDQQNHTVSRKSMPFYNNSSHEPKPSGLAKCDVCFQNISQPYTCSNCAKVSCNNCIQRSSMSDQNAHCPICLDSLKDVSPIAQETCRTHNTKVSYYCMTCKIPTCADCAMFEEKHKNHEFEKLDKAYTEKMTEITREVNKLSHKIDSLRNVLVTLDSDIIEVNKNKEAKATELSIVTEQMAQRLGTDLKSKLAVLIAHKGSINCEIMHLQRLQQNLSHQISTWTKGLALIKSDETLKTLQEINTKAIPNDGENKLSLEFVSEITPQFDTGIFLFYPYSELRKTTEIVYSDPLYCYGLKWRLKVYPNGNGNAKGEYLSIFLEMMEGLQGPSRYEYQIEMLNQRNPRNASVVREFVSDFETGECWGYNKFFKINMLEEEGYLMPEKDLIMIKFSVRAQTYYQQCRDQKSYIESLEKSRSETNTLVAELREKLAYETKEKERLLEQLSKPVTKGQDLLNAEEIKTVASSKESNKKDFALNTKSLEAIENELASNNLAFKIQTQKRLESDREVFEELVESNAAGINKEFISKDIEENAQDKNRVSTEDSQCNTAVKEKVDLCAQFEEVLDPEECSFQDMSSCAFEDEEEIVHHDLNDVEHVEPVQNHDEEDIREIDELEETDNRKPQTNKRQQGGNNLHTQDIIKDDSFEKPFDYEHQGIPREKRERELFTLKGHNFEDMGSWKKRPDVTESSLWKNGTNSQQKGYHEQKVIPKFNNEDLF